ncbi:DUF5819 family protein [Herbiconiux liukaitaii]|uniref:DUF5819 family protein n=1 Tax=Herbiconiux liukaitaii TaxID=3342799 RepID=UPI0035BA3DBB
MQRKKPKASRKAKRAPGTKPAASAGKPAASTGKPAASTGKPTTPRAGASGSAANRTDPAASGPNTKRNGPTAGPNRSADRSATTATADNAAKAPGANADIKMAASTKAAASTNAASGAKSDAGTNGAAGAKSAVDTTSPAGSIAAAGTKSSAGTKTGAGAGATGSKASAPKRTRLAAVATALTLAVVAGYTIVSTSFTFPSSPANAAVNEAFAPYFSQRWDVFAPNLLKVNSALQIQVQWRDDAGDLVHSEWVDVTGTELNAIENTPMPSRIAKSTANAAVAYITRFDELTDEQKTRVQDTFIERTDDGGFQPIPDDELVDEIKNLGDGEDDTNTVPLLRYDYMLIRYATAYGEAYFDRDVERVRWRVQFDRPNDFEHRNDTERQTPINELEFGWRQPAEQPDPETVAIFDDVIERYAR